MTTTMSERSQKIIVRAADRYGVALYTCTLFECSDMAQSIKDTILSGTAIKVFFNRGETAPAFFEVL